MKRLVAVLQCIFVTAASLTLSSPREDIHDKHKVPELSKSSKATKLVWLLGCSIDNQAFVNACRSADAYIMPGHLTNWSQIPPYKTKWCTSGAFTLVFSFHPGASPPPYFDYPPYFDAEKFNSTTQDSVRSVSKQIVQTFGKAPDATIVDSSMWDAANWWKKDGLPQNWSAPYKEIHQWSDTTVPNFLKLVQDTFPSTRVAFRSPPPVFKSCDDPQFMWMCVGHEIIEEMYKCLLKSVSGPSHLLYGKYHLIDYHKIVEEYKVRKGSLRDLYADVAHPGAKLSTAYMDAVLNWVNEV